MFNKLLVPVDMSTDEPGIHNCPRASEMQTAFNAEVRLITVLPGYNMPMVASYFPEHALENLRKHMIQDMEKLASRFFDTAPEIVVRTGKRAQEIIRDADEWGADAIILGSRQVAGRNSELKLGSVGAAVAERAHCSVLISR